LRTPAWLLEKIEGWMSSGATGEVTIHLKRGRVRNMTWKESWLPPEGVLCGRCGDRMALAEGGLACPRCDSKATASQIQRLDKTARDVVA